MDEDQKFRKSSFFTLSEVEKIDNKNTEELKKIISKIGWPTISKVGGKAAHASWLLAQHTRDDKFREKCLELMKENSDDVSRKDIAFLEDRVCLKKYGYQVYGTQVKTETQRGKLVTELLPVKDPGKLKTLRKSMGLDSIEDQIKRCEKIFSKLHRDNK